MTTTETPNTPIAEALWSKAAKYEVLMKNAARAGNDREAQRFRGYMMINRGQALVHDADQDPRA